MILQGHPRRDLNLDWALDRLVMRLALTHMQYENQYRLLMGKALSRAIKSQELEKAFTYSIAPYTADIYYSHETIIKKLIARYKEVFGDGPPPAPSTG